MRAGRDDLEIILVVVHVAGPALLGRGGGSGGRFALVRPVRPRLRLRLRITAMARPTEAVFPIERTIVVVDAVSPAVPASVPSCIDPPLAIFAAVVLLDGFGVFRPAVVGDLRVPGSMRSGPGKPTIIRGGFQRVIIRVRGGRFRPPLMLSGRPELFLAIGGPGRHPHVLLGIAAEGLGRHRTMVICIRMMQRWIVEAVHGGMRMGMRRMMSVTVTVTMTVTLSLRMRLRMRLRKILRMGLRVRSGIILRLGLRTRLRKILRMRRRISLRISLSRRIECFFRRDQSGIGVFVRQSSMRRIGRGPGEIDDLFAEAGAAFTRSEGLSLEDHMDRDGRLLALGIEPDPGDQGGQCIFKPRILLVLPFDLAVQQVPLDPFEVGMQILLLHRDAPLLLVADLEQQLLFRQLHVGPLIAFPRLGLSRCAFLDLGQGEAHIGRRHLGVRVEARGRVVHATIER